MFVLSFFEQIHVRPRYYRDGADALIMRLELSTWEGAPVRESNPVKDVQ